MSGTWKKHVNRLLCMALLGLVLLSAAAPGIHARTELSCSLTVDYVYDELPVPGVTFRLYRVAELNERYEPVFTGVFADVRLVTESLEEEALDLYTLVVDRQVQPEYTLTTDEAGQASVSNLIAGVFLLAAEPVTLDGFTYYVDKQIVSLPVQRDGHWEAALTLRPKCSRLPVQDLIEVTVEKRWEDRGYENDRPDAIGVSLLKDGKIVANAVLSPANSWTHTWSDLLPNTNWSVQEDVPEGYTMELKREGNTFILTNHRKTVPQTGAIWWPVITAAVLGLVLILLGTSLMRSRGRHA